MKILILKIRKKTVDDSHAPGSPGPVSVVSVGLPGLQVVALVVDGRVRGVGRRGHSGGAQGSGRPLPYRP